MYVRPLRNAEPPIIAPKRLEQFLYDVFHNFSELLAHHKRLVESLHEIQREEHPQIRSITEKVFDAALNFREAYMEYIPNYPIAAYRIDDEMANNPAFKDFVNVSTKPTSGSALWELTLYLAYHPASGRSSTRYEKLHQPPDPPAVTL